MEATRRGIVYTGGDYVLFEKFPGFVGLVPWSCCHGLKCLDPSGADWAGPGV